MDMPTSDEEVQSTSDGPSDRQDKNTRTATRAPSIIVGIVAAVVVALSVFYLLRPEPLLVQGEVDATRLDIAALAAVARRTGLLVRREPRKRIVPPFAGNEVRA